MHAPSRRRRWPFAAASALLVLTVAGGTASASRGRAGDDARARAVALRAGASTHVTAEAAGGRSDRAAGLTLAVPETLLVRSAASAADTVVGTGLRARAAAELGDVEVQAATARLERLVATALDEAGHEVRRVVGAACRGGRPVGAEAVVAAAVTGVARVDAGGPFGALHLDASAEAELRAGVGVVLDGERLFAPLCHRRIDRLTSRLVAAIEPVVTVALDAHLSLSLTALRTECRLDRDGGAADTELVVDGRTAVLLGLGAAAHDADVIVRPAPGTNVDLGGDVTLALNEQHGEHRPGRSARITVHGAVLRVGGAVVAVAASSDCELRGDVAVAAAPAGGASGTTGTGAGVEAGDGSASRAGASGATRRHDGGWLVSVEADGRLRATDQL